MIDAKAVVADLDRFGRARGGEDGVAGLDGWLREALQGLPVQFGRDGAGGAWVLLPGASERVVVLGASSTTGGDLRSRLGVITGVETIKALAKRFPSPLPCGVQLQLGPAEAQPPAGASGAAALQGATAGEGGAATGAEPRPSAYLQLRMESGTELVTAGRSLGVGAADEAGTGSGWNPRLTALAAEAIQELTGTFAALHEGPEGQARAMLQRGVPAAVMLVQAFAAGDDGALPDGAKLHVLQAAEAFGRWVEATVHLLAGDGVDLWALEHRVPQS